MTQANTTTLNALKNLPLHKPAETIRPGFDTADGFALMQRTATLLANSTLVPSMYRLYDEKTGKENPSAISNCVIALNMSNRMGADPLMIMQNLYMVDSRPAWSSQFIIACLNTCGKFSPLRFKLTPIGEKNVNYTGVRWENQRKVPFTNTETIIDMKCIAWAVENKTDELLESPPITVEIAVKEGWYSKNGSKWKTMPELMLRYRTASAFGRLYSPELLMGMKTVDELEDTYDMEQSQNGSYELSLESLRNEEHVLPQEAVEKQSQKATVKAEKEQSPQTATENKPKAKGSLSEAKTKKEATIATPPTESSTTSYSVTCPNTGKQEDEIDCANKPCRQGCPSFE